MDSLFCGKATGRRTCHRHVRLDGPFEPILKLKMSNPLRGSLIFWWRRMDSNHRRQSQQIYSLSPLATWVLLRMQLAEEGGAGGRIRTPDLLITNQLLYRLSYTSTEAFRATAELIITAGNGLVNHFSKRILKDEEMAPHAAMES